MSEYTLWLNLNIRGHSVKYKRVILGAKVKYNFLKPKLYLKNKILEHVYDKGSVIFYTENKLNIN